MAIDYSRLQAFLAAVQHGGFSAAARALGKTQSAISQAVLNLEKDLAQPLFVREGRRVRLTEAGEILRHHGEAAMSQLAQAERRLVSLSGLDAGNLVISVPDTLACFVLPPVLAAFRREHPQISVCLETRPTPATASAVRERKADIGFITLPLPDQDEVRASAGLRVESLGHAHDVAIVAPEHPLAGLGHTSLKTLSAHPLLLLRRGTSSRHFFDAAFAQVDAIPEVSMETDSIELLKRLAELGFGAALVPHYSIAAELRAGALQALEVEDLPKRSIGLLLPATDPIAASAKAFAELVARCY